MSRTRRKVSRALIGILACTLMLGLVFWLHNLTRTKAAAPDARADAHQPPPPPLAPKKGVIVAPTAETIGRPGDSHKPTALITQTPTSPPRALAPVGEPITAGGSPSSGSPPNATPPSASPLPDAQAKLYAGDLLAARNTLNAALAARNLSDADTRAAKRLLDQANQTILFSSRRFPADASAGVYTVKQGDRLSRIAAQHDVPWELLSRINDNLVPSKLQAGKEIKIVHGPFHAVVDKSDFILEIWQGPPNESNSMYITSFPVGLGRDDSTPTGAWMVETEKKIKNPTYFSPRGEGVIAADDPDNPLGEYWIGLSGIDGQAIGKQSYGIHGTIRPDSIGKQESMGCVRLTNENAAVVYDLLAAGKSTVTVRE